MKRCHSAGEPCPHEATLVARLAGVGDLPLCRECFDTYIGLGMDIRELEAEPFVPLWRRNLSSKDLTGSVLHRSVA